MYNLKRNILLVLFLFLLGCSPADDPETLGITNVNIVDVASGSIIPDQSVITKNGRISHIGSANEALNASQTIDGRGKYLIPGLWEMHAHVSSDEQSRNILFPLYVINGVTGIRSMGTDCFDRAVRPCHDLKDPIHVTNQWRSDIADGRQIGPRIIAGSDFVVGPGPGGTSTMLNPATEEERFIVK